MALRRFALVFGDTIARVVEAERNPFHGSLRSIDVTGIPAQAGNTVDAVGNVGPSVAYGPAEVAERKRAMLSGESLFHGSSGIWLPKNDPNGHRFDTAPAALGMLSALSAAGSDHTPAADGTLVAIPASEVYSEAGLHLAACLAHEAELRDAMVDNPDVDIAAGWPEDGEPTEVLSAAPTLAPPARAGTGIIPELSPDAPPAVPPIEVGGTVEAPTVRLD